MRLGITWREELGLPGQPYLVRWVLNLGLFSVRLHHWLSSDDLRNPHDHAWWFITWVLKGDYLDIGSEQIQWMYRWRCAFRRAKHIHSVRILKPTWTLMLTGPARRRWGFWVDGKFKRANKYFFENGHHAPDGGAPVRTVRGDHDGA